MHECKFLIFLSSHDTLVFRDDGDEIVMDIYHDEIFGSFIFDIVGVSQIQIRFQFDQ